MRAFRPAGGRCTTVTHAPQAGDTSRGQRPAAEGGASWLAGGTPRRSRG